MEVIGIILTAAVAVIAVAAFFTARYYVRSQWLKIDKMLSISTAELKSGSYCLDETLDARLYQRMLDLYRNLEMEYRQADTEKKTVKAYIAELSHQMKMPLANVSLYNNLMLEEELTEEEQAEFEQKIHSEIEKMQWLLASLTKITRLESGAIAFEVKEVPLDSTLRLATESVMGQIRQKEITIVAEGDFKEVVRQNPRWLAEAIVNILENAVKYSEAGSKIKIWAEPLELYLRLNITDSGIGIEKSDYNSIFKRFYRGKNVEDRAGSGLGLYLAQLILNKQDGYITVQSEPGWGSCFSIYLKRQL